jgi:hypothetical protein
VRLDLIVAQLVKYLRLLWKLEFYFRVHSCFPFDPVLGTVYLDSTCKNAVFMFTLSSSTLTYP